jgi:pimeloyl-ACP methyl ester carboxylesterase
MIRIAIIVCLAWTIVAPASAQTGPTDQFLDSNGVKIRYVEAGSGTPVLLFHAMSESVDMWIDTGVFGKLSEEFHVIAFDQRGHGKSDKPHQPDAYGLHMVEDAAKLLAHLRIDAVHVIGYSMGGYVAGRFAATYPHRVLTATFGGSSVMSPSLWAARFENRIGPIADALERGDPRPLLGRQATGEELDRRAAELLSTNDPIALAAAARSFEAMTLTSDEIKGLAFPILVVVGSEDLPESRLEAFEDLQPDLEYLVIEGATHGGTTGTVPRPEFIRAIVEFLASHPRAN